MANNFWNTIKGFFGGGKDDNTSTGSSGAGTAVSATQPTQQSTIRSYNSGIQGTRQYAEQNREAYQQQYSLARRAGVSDDQFVKDYGSGVRWLDEANNTSPAIRQYDSGVAGTRQYAEAHMEEYKTQYDLARKAGISDQDFLSLYGNGTRWQDVTERPITAYNSGVQGTREYAEAHMDEYKEQYQLARQLGLSDDQFLQAYGSGTRWRQEQSYLERANQMGEGKEPGVLDQAASWINDSKLWNDMQDRRLKRWQERYGSSTFADDFWGQTQANYGVGFLSQELNRVYNDLADNPDDEHDIQYVAQLEKMLEEFQMRNTEALDDENVQLSWISKHLAGYAPQLVAEVVPAAAVFAGGVAATLLTGGAAGAAVAAGWNAYRVARTATSAINAYEITRGAAYSSLVKAGASANVAREAATDEAILSSIVEMGDTAFEYFGKIPGLSKIFGGNKAASETLGAAVKSWLLEIPQEGGEEFVQEVLSAANQERVLAGDGDAGIFNLIRYWGRYHIQMARGEHSDELAQAMEAAKGGAIIGAMMGGAHLVGGRIQQGVNNTRTTSILNSIVENPTGLAAANDDTLNYYLKAAQNDSTKNEQAAKLIQEELDTREKLRGSIVDDHGKPTYRYMTDEQKAELKSQLETMQRDDITADKVDLLGLNLLYDQCLASGADKRITNMLREEWAFRKTEAAQRQLENQRQAEQQMAQAQQQTQEQVPQNPVAEESQAAPAAAAEEASVPVQEKIESVEAPDAVVAGEDNNPVLKTKRIRSRSKWTPKQLQLFTHAELVEALKLMQDSGDKKTAKAIQTELERRFNDFEAAKAIAEENERSLDAALRDSDQSTYRSMSDNELRSALGKAKASGDVSASTLISNEINRRSLPVPAKKNNQDTQKRQKAVPKAGDSWQTNAANVQFDESGKPIPKREKAKTPQQESREFFGDTSKDAKRESNQYPGAHDFAAISQTSGDPIPESLDPDSVRGYQEYYGLSDEELLDLMTKVASDIKDYGYASVFGYAPSEEEQTRIENLLDSLDNDSQLREYWKPGEEFEEYWADKVASGTSYVETHAVSQRTENGSTITVEEDADGNRYESEVISSINGKPDADIRTVAGGKILPDSQISKNFSRVRDFFSRWLVKSIVAADSRFVKRQYADNGAVHYSGEYEGLYSKQNANIATNANRKGNFPHEFTHHLQRIAEEVDNGKARRLIDALLSDDKVISRQDYEMARKIIEANYGSSIRKENMRLSKKELQAWQAHNPTATQDEVLDKASELLAKYEQEAKDNVVRRELFARIVAKTDTGDVKTSNSTMPLIQKTEFLEFLKLAASAAENVTDITAEDIDVLLSWYTEMAATSDAGHDLGTSVNILSDLLQQREKGTPANGQKGLDADAGGDQDLAGGVPKKRSLGGRDSGTGDAAGLGPGLRGRTVSGDRGGSEEQFRAERRGDASGEGSQQKKWWGQGLYRPSEEELASYRRPSKAEVTEFIESREKDRPDAISAERFWEYMSRNRGKGKTMWDTMKGFYWQEYYLNNWEQQRSQIEGARAAMKAIFEKWRKDGYDALADNEQEVIDNWLKKQEYNKNVVAIMRQLLKDGYSSLSPDQRATANIEILYQLDTYDPDLRKQLSSDSAFFNESISEEQEAKFKQAAADIIEKLQGKRGAGFQDRPQYNRLFSDPEETIDEYLASLESEDESNIPPEQEAPVDDDERFMPATPAEQRRRRRETHGKYAEQAPIGEPPSGKPIPLEQRWMPEAPRDITAEEREFAAKQDYEQREQRAADVAAARQDRDLLGLGNSERAWQAWNSAMDITQRKFDFDKGDISELSREDRQKRKAMDALRNAAKEFSESRITAYQFAKYVLNAQRDMNLGQYLNEKTEGRLLNAMQSVVDAYEEAMEPTTASDSVAQRYAYEAQRAIKTLDTRMVRWADADNLKVKLGEEADRTVGADKRLRRRKARFNQTGETFADTTANFLTRMQINPTNVFRGLFGGWNKYGGSLGYDISEQQNNATRVNQSIIANANMAYLDVRKMKGFQKFAQQQDVKSVDLLGGSINLSQQQIVSLYKTVRTLLADARQSVNEIVVQDGKGGNEQTLYRLDDNGEARPLTRDELKDMQRTLWSNIDEVGKAYLEVTDDVLEDLGKRNADVEEKVYGVRPRTYKRGDYIPVRYDSNGKHNFGDDSIQFKFTQERTRKGGGAVLVEPVTAAIDRYINQSANHIAYTELGDQLALMNNSGRTLTQIMEENYGKQMGEWMTNYVTDMNDFNPKENTDGVSNLLRKGRQAVQTGALVGSVSVPMKQISSYWAAAGRLRMSTLRKAYRIKFIGAKTDGTQNPILYYRKVGGIDPTMSEIMKSDGLWAKMRNKSKILQAMEKSIPLMDFRTIDNLYTACAIEVHEDNPKLDVKSDKYQQMVNEKFEDVVISTQPIFTRNARAEYSRTNSEFIKMFSMFRTQQTQNLNNIMQAIGEARAAKGTLGQAMAKDMLSETIKGQAASALSLSLLTVAADVLLHKLRKYKDDDDEIDPEKVIERIGLNAIEAGAGTVWFADSALKYAIDTINKAQGKDSSEFYGVNMGIVSTIQNAGEAIANLAEKPTLSNLQYTAGYVSQAFGVPLSNVYRMLNAALMWTKDITGHIEGDTKPGQWDDILRYLDSEVLLHPWGDNLNHKVHVMVNAELNGNDRRAEDIQNDLGGGDKVESAIRSEAKTRYLEEAISREDAENLLIKYTGMDAEDIQKKNDFWEFLRDNPKYQDSDKYPGVTESFVQHWNDEGKPSGIPINNFYEYMRKASNTHSIDVDGDGKTNGRADITKQQQLIEYINGLNLTSEQKDAMWLAFGYKTTSAAYKNRPWK